MLYCFDAIQVPYPAFHASYFTTLLPAETSVWFADNAAAWIDALSSDSQYGQFPERLVGTSIAHKLHDLQRDLDAPLPLK